MARNYYKDQISVDKSTVVINKTSRIFDNKIVRCCNMAYNDDDEFVLHEDLCEWMRNNVEFQWDVVQRDDDIVFVFDDESDAALFKLTYS